MKILFVSMPSIHFYRWIENLKETDYDFYWFDVLNKGETKELGLIPQFTNWKKRKIRPLKGEFFLHKKLPVIHELVKPYLEKTANEALEEIINDIKPDIVHSFEMQNCSYSILKTMNKFKTIKWIYSCWGSDLYYYQNFKRHNFKIRNVLKRTDYLITDCERDYEIAKKLGFKNIFLGVIPGGTGFRITELKSKKIPVSKRKIIFVKGYEHTFGRGLNIVKALEMINTDDYQVIIFGAHDILKSYIQDKKINYKVYWRHELSRNDVLTILGKSLLYIGNSISDGIPNSLLEAIVMGAFPIQSNPGGATAEIINHGINGLLINDANDIQEIKETILKALKSDNLISQAYSVNSLIAQKRLDYQINKDKSIEVYRRSIE